MFLYGWPHLAMLQVILLSHSHSMEALFTTEWVTTCLLTLGSSFSHPTQHRWTAHTYKTAMCRSTQGIQGEPDVLDTKSGAQCMATSLMFPKLVCLRPPKRNMLQALVAECQCCQDGRLELLRQTQHRQSDAFSAVNAKSIRWC